MIVCTTVIPTINRATLERSVKSALAQELGADAHEILVFNNSKAPLPETDWLSSPQVKIINTHSNVNDASNKGAEMAAGKYINFLHDDDYLLPGALRALMDAAEASGDVWVCGAYNLIDDDGRFMSTVRPVFRKNFFAKLVAGECLHLAASIVNRAAILQAGSFDLAIPGQSDIDLETQMALRGDFGYIDQIVATVRVAGGKGKTHDWTSHTKQDFRNMREKALNSPGARRRIVDSVRGDVFSRGRACRSYLFSAVLNARMGKLGVAGRRVLAFLSLAGLHCVRPRFWRGLLFRSHWHNVQKREQEEYFQANYPTEEVGFWRA